MGSPFTIVNGWLRIHGHDFQRIRLDAIKMYRPSITLGSVDGVFVWLFGGGSAYIALPEATHNVALLAALDEHFAK